MQPSGAEHESSWPLTGRDEELDLLRRSVPHGVVVVGGAAGVGKTRLVRDWCRATTDGALVVTATAATATIPFGAFARWVPDHLLPGGDRLSMLRGLADRVAASSSTVVVDDAHLLDDASAALLLHLADHHPTVLIATVRTGEPTPDAVTALWRDGRGTRIDLLPLSRLEVERLVAAPPPRPPRPGGTGRGLDTVRRQPAVRARAHRRRTGRRNASTRRRHLALGPQHRTTSEAG
jgi:hypothetical protein